jgi:hypothetical protein
MDTPIENTASSDPAAAEVTPMLRDDAYALGRELQSFAAAQACLDHDFCDLVDRFDASGALAYFDGITSTAHYLAWACAMNATVAREHVRVSRTLREMPQTKDLFRLGRLSYSKVRELTRLVGAVDEAELCELALELTASQLARTVSSFRLTADPRRRGLQPPRVRTHAPRHRPRGRVRQGRLTPTLSDVPTPTSTGRVTVSRRGPYPAAWRSGPSRGPAGRA